MAMPQIRRRWTTNEVRALMDESRAWPRYELIGGELLVTPAPNSPHQIAVMEIWSIINSYVERFHLGLTLTSPADLELEPGTIAQPDVFVIPKGTEIAGERLEWPDVKALLLAVEIISPSSVRTDRVTKRDFYLQSGVAEYWIVDLDARVVETWTPGQEAPVIVRDVLTWAPAPTPLTIDLPALFDRVSDKARMIV
jgi:Uma2 family endonuclease